MMLPLPSAAVSGSTWEVDVEQVLVREERLDF